RVHADRAAWRAEWQATQLRRLADADPENWAAGQRAELAEWSARMAAERAEWLHRMLGPGDGETPPDTPQPPTPPGDPDGSPHGPGTPPQRPPASSGAEAPPRTDEAPAHEPAPA